MPLCRSRCSWTLSAIAVLGFLSFAVPAHAVIEFDQNVTPEVIFGTGNDNGSFTTDRNADAGVELGLRAKLRFDAAGDPQNIFNSNGDGTYTFDAGQAVGGFSFDPSSPATTPIWNFEFAINSNFNGNGVNLDQLTYQIDIDFDPGLGTNFLTFDPIFTPSGAFGANPCFDHALGTNATGNGGGTSIDCDPATNADGDTDWANGIAANNVAQNSWNMEFFNNTPFDTFDPNTPGVYTFVLTAFQGSGPVASTSIDVIVAAVPEPGTLATFAVALAGLGYFGRRRRAK